MKIDERQYPHPVHSIFSDDLVDCNFQITPRIQVAKEFYKISAIAHTSSSDLKSLVVSKKALFSLHIECPATRFRRLVTSSNEEFFEDIPADYLAGRVEICTLMVAAENIPEYRNKNFHADYSNSSFFVRKGDVLAVGNSVVFEANKDVDPLQNVVSIFRVRLNIDPDAEPLFVSLQDHSVVILLSEKNFIAYTELRRDQDHQRTLASMIVVPSLVYVIEMVRASFADGEQGADEDFSTKRWFKVIARKLLQLGYQPDSPNMWRDVCSLSLAQKLIGDPLTYSLRSIADADEDDVRD